MGYAHNRSCARKLLCKTEEASETAAWELQEKIYWEKRAYLLSPRPHYDHRIFEREKYIFRFLRDRISRKHLLEVGCGTSSSVRDCLDPFQYNFFYLGVDVALKPLRIAKKFTHGDFIQCTCRRMPLKIKTFDVVLCLGVIHHLPDGEKNISLLSNLVKKKGYFIAVEPVLSQSSLRMIASRAFKTKFGYQSPHECELDEECFIRECLKIGELVALHKNYSPIMALFLYLTGKISKRLLFNRMALNIIFLLDQLTIKLFGRVSELLNAGQYIVIVKKK